MKNLIRSFLLVAILASCKHADSPQIDNSNQILIRKYFSHFNQHNWKKMADMYVENAAFKDPTFGTEIVKQSKKQIIAKYSELHKTFPDIRDNIIHLYPSGPGYMIVEFISTGTAPDGSKFKLPICTVFTIKNGKIIQDYTYYDNVED